jgi:hypothetical protein
MKGGPNNAPRVGCDAVKRPNRVQKSLLGQVDNLYVDDDRNLQFADVSRTGIFYFGKRHYLIPVEVIAEEDPGYITLTVDQQTIQSAPTLGDPHAAPDEGLQRAAREHCGLAAVPPPEP